MVYITRNIETTITIAAKMFSTVLITGARQYFARRKMSVKQTGYKEIWEIIHKGSMPAIYANELDRQMFYASYTKTYIERDVRESSLPIKK